MILLNSLALCGHQVRGKVLVQKTEPGMVPGYGVAFLDE